MNERILLAEDDPAIAAGISDLLRLDGYEVDVARDGASALESFRNRKPELVLLDVMMPKLSGYDVCREIRRNDPVTPVLMITAKGQEIDKVIGLELGADDYIVKPFGMSELSARVRAVLRRCAAVKNAAIRGAAISIGGVTVDFDSMTGSRGGDAFSLTPKETELLRYFADNPGKVLSREVLLEEIWGYDASMDITTRSVDQHVARLRQKIETDPTDPKILITVHGAGYRFDCEGEGVRLGQSSCLR